jgi:hypothetical protein
MEKLDYSFGTLRVPSVWQPCHVEEIVKYLHHRGYQFEVYKEFDTSQYILVRDNMYCYYKKASEICEALISLYFQEKHDEEVAYFEARKKASVKNKQFSEVIFKYEKN